VQSASHGLRRLPMHACSSSEALLFWPFQEVDAQDVHGVWYKAFVIAASGSGRRLKYKVHFSGWETVCDEIVAPVRLRLRTEDAEEGPNGAESEAQVRKLYPHFNIFTAPDLRPLLKESCRRQQPVASSTCHTAPYSEQPRHPPAADASPPHGAGAHAPTARKQKRQKPANQKIYKALEEATGRQKEAVQYLRQHARHVVQKMSDRRLLRAVQHVMRTWNARSLEAIFNHAIEFITDPIRGDNDSSESDEVIWISSSSDEGDGNDSDAAPSAVVIPDADSDAAGFPSHPALQDQPTVPPAQADTGIGHVQLDVDRDAHAADTHASGAPQQQTQCLVKGCGGHWTSKSNKMQHESSKKHMSALLRQRLQNASCGGTDADFVAASLASPSSAPGLPTAAAGAAVVVTTAAVLDASSAMLPPAPSAAKCAPPTTHASLVDAPSAALQPSRGRGRLKQSRTNSTASEAASACTSAPATPLSPEAGEKNAGSSGEAAQEGGSDHGDGHASECMFCSDGGHLLLCEFAGCRHVAHLDCAGLSEQPAEEQPWFCSEHAAPSSSKQAQACGWRLQSHALCPQSCCKSESCKCPCTECGSAQGSRAFCRTCNRCFHQ
jgi:hypothetical protein